jgi:hypothetical protein
VCAPVARRFAECEEQSHSRIGIADCRLQLIGSETQPLTSHRDRRNHLSGDDVFVVLLPVRHTDQFATAIVDLPEEAVESTNSRYCVADRRLGGRPVNRPPS